MKKFQSLGRSLSKAEQKLILGGGDVLAIDGGGSGESACACSSNEDCGTKSCPGSRCFNFNGKNQCVSWPF